MIFKDIQNNQIRVIDGDDHIGLITYYYQYKEWRFATIHMHAYTGKQLKKISKMLRELNNV